MRVISEKHDRKVRPAPSGPVTRAERSASVRPAANGHGVCLISVPNISCGACVARIERALIDCPGVVAARANLTLRQVRVTLTDANTDPSPGYEALAALGYTARPLDPSDTEPASAQQDGPDLLRCIAVAGFGAMNVMLLSVAVWSGAEATTRDTFHLISALIAVPVVAYAGQPFFRSALVVLRGGRLNMDVPIALAVLLALALSLSELLQGGDHVFFDAAVTLLFFLLTGRYLDQLMRDRARSAVTGLARLSPKGAMARGPDGSLEWIALHAVAKGMILHIDAGERVPVDVRILHGDTDLDRSLVTGEAMPVAASPGTELEAGTLNLTGGIEVEVLRPVAESFLAEMMRMLSAAETSRSTYVRIADRAARLYAPVVHLLAVATFAGWLLVTGDWQVSAFVAISVLIITCPCALGLAVPVAQVVAAGRLMRSGILMKDGSALERLAQIDRAVFDKTGTLTTGTPMVTSCFEGEAEQREASKALAMQSRHPAAQAIAAHLPEVACEVADAVEVPGFGVEGRVHGRRARLGRARWVAEIAADPQAATGPAFAFEGAPALSFDLSETLRPGAVDTISDMQSSGIPVTMLSGDDAARVAQVAETLGIAEAHHGMTPARKVGVLEDLRDRGHRALMVGDGLNDTAALAAAHVSMAPSTAADAGRTAADFVFLRDGLDAVATAQDVARATARVVRQNFGLAIAYNCIAIPLAVAGLVTPLIAALAMSASSILVIGNSLRLNGKRAAAPLQSVERGPVAIPA